MIVGTSGQIQSLNSSRLAENQPKRAEPSGSLLPLSRRSETVDISEAGRSRLESEMQNLERARESRGIVDLRGHDGKLRLGLMAMGRSTVDDWSAKGLKLSEETILAAADAFQEGFREHLEKGGIAGSSVALNRHQIVMNSQAVPEWFVQEYERALSSIDNVELRRAFENGDTFFSSQPSTSQAEALSRYAAVAKSL